MNSKQPRKQRKEVHEAPMHRRQNMVNASLSENLRDEYDRRSLPLRQGDTVEIMRGDFSGLTGEVTDVDLSSGKVFVDGIEKEKVDGTEVKVPLQPSNLKIIDAVMTDRRRVEIIERSGGEAEVEEVEEAEEETEEGDGTEGAKCPICEETFPDNNAVNVHISEEHKEYATGDGA